MCQLYLNKTDLKGRRKRESSGESLECWLDLLNTRAQTQVLSLSVHCFSPRPYCLWITMGRQVQKPGEQPGGRRWGWLVPKGGACSDHLLLWSLLLRTTLFLPQLELRICSSSSWSRAFAALLDAIHTVNQFRPALRLRFTLRYHLETLDWKGLIHSNSLHNFWADFLWLYLSSINVPIYLISKLSALTTESLDGSFSALQSPDCISEWAQKPENREGKRM